MKLLLLICVVLFVQGVSFGQENLLPAKSNDNEALRLFKIDSAHADYPSALSHYKRYKALKDSVLNDTKNRQIALLNIQYQTKKKDHELNLREQNISLLKKQGQLQGNNLEQAKLVRKMIIAGAIILVLLLGLSYNRYRLKQHANLRLQAQQAEINKKNESLETLANQKDILLEEKEWLMKEIHHRVKNNLQIVISLLNTQSVYLDDDKAFAAIRESQHRMQSIALIHQKLYQSESRALIDTKTYMTELIDYLCNSFDTGKRITFERDIMAMELDAARAVPIGLILNEAITNAIKYAFPQNNEGMISISLTSINPDIFKLVISDNGIGLPADFKIEKCRSLGVTLMKGLCKQINSSFKLENNNGVKISIEFTDNKSLGLSNRQMAK